MTKDPVCQMSVDEKKAAATSVYKEKTYYFCAKGCKEKFDKEPGNMSRNQQRTKAAVINAHNKI